MDCGWSSSAAGWACPASPPHEPARRCSPRTHAAEALALVERNARANEVDVETATVDWAQPGELVRRAPFDLVLCADVLYERASVAQLLTLLPRLGPEAWLADPGRPAAEEFIERAAGLWTVETRVRGVVRIHRLILQRPLSDASGA